MANAEAKLGQSLDSIIEENKKKATTGKPRAMRIDGARKSIRVQGASRQSRGQGQATTAIRQRATDAGLGVKAAGVQKRTSRAPTYDFDAMDVDEYGATAPPRRQWRDQPGRSAGAYGGGGAFRRRPETFVPRGNSDGLWQHDLYDPHQGPSRRTRAPLSMGGRLAQQHAEGYTLTVSNLDFTVSEADIKELFETCGPLLQSFIHFDTSGRSEGTATVVYRSKESADKAIKEYHGVMLDKKELHIQYATDQTVHKLSSGKVLSRTIDNNGASAGPGSSATFRRALDALPVRGMGDGGAPRRRPGGAGGGGGGGGSAFGRMGGSGGGGSGGPPRTMRGRLRSTVGRTKSDLDAELDDMKE